MHDKMTPAESTIAKSISEIVDSASTLVFTEI